MTTKVITGQALDKLVNYGNETDTSYQSIGASMVAPSWFARFTHNYYFEKDTCHLWNYTHDEYQGKVRSGFGNC
jgi:hypothetical protein